MMANLLEGLSQAVHLEAGNKGLKRAREFRKLRLGLDQRAQAALEADDVAALRKLEHGIELGLIRNLTYANGVRLGGHLRNGHGGLPAQAQQPAQRVIKLGFA